MIWPLALNILISVINLGMNQVDHYGFNLNNQSSDLYESIAPVFKVIMITGWVDIVIMIASIALVDTLTLFIRFFSCILFSIVLFIHSFRFFSLSLSYYC